MALVPESVADRIRVPGVGFRHLTPRSSVRCQLAAVTTNAARGEPLVNFLAALAPAAEEPASLSEEPLRWLRLAPLPALGAPGRASRDRRERLTPLQREVELVARGDSQLRIDAIEMRRDRTV
jgi:hypothetical protein